MSKIYVPNYNNNNCVVIRSEGVIRKYETTPTYNSNINYIDYYIRSDYYEVSGVQNFTSYSTLPTCTPSNHITTDFYHRIDFPNILLMFLIISIFAIYLPLKIFSRLIRRFQ